MYFEPVIEYELSNFIPCITAHKVRLGQCHQSAAKENNVLHAYHVSKCRDNGLHGVEAPRYRKALRDAMPTVLPVNSHACIF